MRKNCLFTVCFNYHDFSVADAKLLKVLEQVIRETSRLMLLMRK